MRWTSQKDDRLALLAGLPLHLLAREIGTSEVAVRKRAEIIGISVKRGDGGAEGCRERWRLRMPEMKEALRREMARFA